MKFELKKYKRGQQKEIIKISLFLGILLLFIITRPSFAEQEIKNIQFKLVLSPNNLVNEAYSKLHYNSQDLYVENKALLTEKDISKITIRKSESKYKPAALLFRFNDTGKGKLFEVTKEFIGGRMAIFIGGEFILAPRIHETISDGRMIITSEELDEAKLESIAKKAGIKPEYEIEPYTAEDRKIDEQLEQTVKEAVEEVNKDFEKEGKPLRYKIDIKNNP